MAWLRAGQRQAVGELGRGPELGVGAGGWGGAAELAPPLAKVVPTRTPRCNPKTSPGKAPERPQDATRGKGQG